MVLAGLIKPSSFIKVFWFSVGGAAAYGSYWQVYKQMWAGARQVAEAHGTLPPQREQKPPEPLFGPAARAGLAASWNKLVDDTLGELARELGRRGM